MDRQDIENIINANIKDNNNREITPKKVRDAFNSILDWLEFLDLGGSTAELDTIYRKIEDSYSIAQINSLLSEIELLPGPAGPKGEDGAPGAKGEDGAPGINGVSPTISDNNTWVIEGEDTGIPIYPKQKHTDYDNDISGIRGEKNQIFNTSRKFVPKSVKVWKGGLRLTPGSSYDFVEIGDNSIQIWGVVLGNGEDNLIVEYIPNE